MCQTLLDLHRAELGRNGISHGRVKQKKSPPPDSNIMQNITVLESSSCDGRTKYGAYVLIRPNEARGFPSVLFTDCIYRSQTVSDTQSLQQ